MYIGATSKEQLRKEIQNYHESGRTLGLPSLYQIGNAAALPGIVGYSIGLPDIHCGYGFAIGNM